MSAVSAVLFHGRTRGGRGIHCDWLPSTSIVIEQRPEPVRHMLAASRTLFFPPPTLGLMWVLICPRRISWTQKYNMPIVCSCLGDSPVQPPFKLCTVAGLDHSLVRVTNQRVVVLIVVRSLRPSVDWPFSVAREEKMHCNPTHTILILHHRLILKASY